MPVVLESGRIGRQASGAVTLTRGQTTLYVTASREDDLKSNLDFIPLSVEHQERFSSAGLTSGAFNKREGRPSDDQILTCRLIDRPLRPLIDAGWRHETQILSWVLSYDGLRSCDPLAIMASSAALWISDVPLAKPVGAVEVGYDETTDAFILNPTLEQFESTHHKLHLTVAGTYDGVLMIEGAADFLSDDVMIRGVTFAHEAIKNICLAMEAFGKAINKPKFTSTLLPPTPDSLQTDLESFLLPQMKQVLTMNHQTPNPYDKDTLSTELFALYDIAFEHFGLTSEDNDCDCDYSKSQVKSAVKTMIGQVMYQIAVETGKRCDGRLLKEIRPIDIETTILPSVHGSALFTRGETQAVATATLGDSGTKKKIDTLDGLSLKRFYLQYTFPPSSVGETGRVGAPGRREIGHGNLAERALAAIVPSEEDFPYSIRLESLITESNGSSSMASVCGGCLALMDAGVPIARPVAGIAMGMLLSDEVNVEDMDDNSVILSDILGSEDALGTMDFKVAGDREGITTFQLDIKCEGLTIETMKRALAQASEGRAHILNQMESALPSSRSELPKTVPRMQSFQISPDSIGKVIGPGGKQIRAIIEDFELTNMDVREEGMIQMTGMDTQKLEKAQAFVKELLEKADKGGRGAGGRGPKVEYNGPPPEEDVIYVAKITGIHQFGVFLEILPGAEDGSYPGLEGLCHVSELDTQRIRNCEGFVNSLNVETLEVKYRGKNQKGQLQLSRKAVLEERRNGGKSKPSSTPPPPEPKMSSDEVDVIAKAIEGIQDLE